MLFLLLCGLCLLALLWKHHGVLLRKVNVVFSCAVRDYARAGELAFQFNDNWAPSLLVRAVNNGDYRSAIPLGKYFELNDDVKQAIRVYDVVQLKTEGTDAYLNAEVKERLQLLQADRVLPNRSTAPTAMLNIKSDHVTLKPPALSVVPSRPVVAVPNDRHSVHDSGVTRTLANSYKAIKASLHNPNSVDSVSSTTTSLMEVRDLCKSSPRATLVLDRIEQSTTPITILGDETEVDVLCTVWSRIKDANHGEDVRAMLVKSMEDCVDENNSVVCTVGRVSRLVDTLNVVDPLVSIKPRWAVRQEINALAANLFKEVGEEDVELFKTRLRDECKKAYVDTNVLPEDMLKAELSWLDDM